MDDRMISQLTALCPLDGRYADKARELAKIFSEAGFMKYRLGMEIDYLIALSEHEGVAHVRTLAEDEKDQLCKMKELDLEGARIIKLIETKGYGDYEKTNHDLKAIELYVRLLLKDTPVADLTASTHFGLTSEDATNIAYALMISDGVGDHLLPTLEDLQEILDKTFVSPNAALVIVARTHGRPAVGSTLGKELRVFSHRLERQLGQLRKFRILGKLNGAAGNYNALQAAYPNVDWLGFSRMFVTSFNTDVRQIWLEPNLITTQIESHDNYAELFGILARTNTILLDFCQDMWRYISDGWLYVVSRGDVGSSTMPQKINPQDLETAEGNLGIANALLEHFCRMLPVSRLQRHLSDSTVSRCIGMALGHSLLAYKGIMAGLGRIKVNKEAIAEFLSNHPEMISEGIQTILRREGIHDAYDLLKEFTQGKKVTLSDLHAFVETLPISDSVRAELKALTPNTYVGLAEQLAKLPK